MNRGELKRTELLSLDIRELSEELSKMGEPSFRARQIFDWLHNKRITDLSNATNLPSGLREVLSSGYIFDYPSVALEQTDGHGTTKYLLRLADGQAIESVLMHHRHGDSLCISTQVGCRMGCVFCASAKAGFVRNMTVAELISQVYVIASKQKTPPRYLVLMGIGEPLDNYDNVIKFLRLLGCEFGYNISGRNVSLSTCGLVPEINRLKEENFSLTLSVSLHRTTDSQREEVMPIAKRYPLSELVPTVIKYANDTKRRISIEYAIVGGENDTEHDAKRLKDMFRAIDVHINLIPLNSIDEEDEDHDAAAKKFKQRLENLGLTCTVRRRLGVEIEAACGQLRRQDLTR